MELWEGAILAIGGIWLVGRMSRKTATPVQAIISANLNTPVQNTNSSGDTQLVAGEQLTPVAVPLQSGAPKVIYNPVSAPNRIAYSSPMRSVGPMRYQL